MCKHQTSCPNQVAQALIAILLMVAWMSPEHMLSPQLVDVIEFFAGRAKIGRLSKAAGWAPLAFDMLYDRSAFPDGNKKKGKRSRAKSCMDINTAAGFASLASTY